MLSGQEAPTQFGDISFQNIHVFWNNRVNVLAAFDPWRGVAGQPSDRREGVSRHCRPADLTIGVTLPIICRTSASDLSDGVWVMPLQKRTTAKRTGRRFRTGIAKKLGAKVGAGKKVKGVGLLRMLSLHPRVRHALLALERDGMLAGPRTRKLSSRVPPELVKAAMDRSGIDNETDLVTAALAVMAAPDDFGAWLVSQAGRLSEDFELAF